VLLLFYDFLNVFFYFFVNNQFSPAITKARKDASHLFGRKNSSRTCADRNRRENKKNRNRCKTAQLAPRRLIESNDSARKMYIHPMER
jgi:hypothetical protein